MRTFTSWIVKRSIKNYQKTDNLKVRSKYGMLEGWTSIIGNTLIFFVKITLGFTTNSVALIADAIHTLADSVTSAVIIIGFKLAQKPSDEEHPFGHGRMEAVATLIVAVLLFVAGFELFKKSIHSTFHPEMTNAPLSVILIITATILIKEIMSQFAFNLGDMINSDALKADALHHRTDVVATAMVVIALIATRFGFYYVDGIMGALVSFIIFYTAYKIGKEAIDPLLGKAPSKDDLKTIEQLAKQQPGVFGVHDIMFHQYGQTNIVSLHIEVSDKEPVMALHALSEDVEDEIVKEFGGMAVVHIDPVNQDHPQYTQIAQTIKTIINGIDAVASFHELRIVGCHEEHCNVVFDIVLENNVDELDTHDIISSIRNQFASKFPKMKTVIKAEPKYVFNV